MSSGVAPPVVEVLSPAARDTAGLLDPSGCALVIVDFQNDYCHPDGALARGGADVTAAADAASRTVELLGLAHEFGVPCLHVRTEHSHWTDTEAWLSRGTRGTLLHAEENPIVAAGTWGAEPFVVTDDPSDRVIIKHRYSAFVGTSLELSLRAKRRDVFLLAGVATDICVHATALSGLMNGFVPVLVQDCAAGTSEQLHNKAVETFLLSLGPVVDTEAVRQIWGDHAGDRRSSNDARQHAQRP